MKYSIPFWCSVQVLTLANGDRILMTPQMKAMFEPENLNNASPATVSRAGIIYVSDVELGWGPVVESWLNKKREPEVAALRPCFDKLVGAMLDFVRYETLLLLYQEFAVISIYPSGSLEFAHAAVNLTTSH